MKSGEHLINECRVWRHQLAEFIPEVVGHQAKIELASKVELLGDLIEYVSVRSGPVREASNDSAT